jgi:hypothetical protein
MFVLRRLGNRRPEGEAVAVRESPLFTVACAFERMKSGRLRIIGSQMQREHVYSSTSSMDATGYHSQVGTAMTPIGPFLLVESTTPESVGRSAGV